MRGVYNDAYGIFFLIVFIKAYVFEIDLNCLDEAIQMSTINLCFYKEIEAISNEYQQHVLL